MSRQIYVVDTNVLVDYPDIIPGIDTPRPQSPTVDLTDAHLVIPSAVIRELSSFKKEKNDRGKAARTVLRKVRELTEGQLSEMGDFYHLSAPIEVGDILVSILPVHKSFKKNSPFSPSEDDMDGQIILATLTVEMLNRGMAINGNTGIDEMMSLEASPNITLLTNDNGLAIRARERGIRTQRYGYKCPEPYTGRRDLIVTKELFMEFYNSRRIERKMFEAAFPAERKLAANEFVIMHLENEEDYPSDFDPNNNPYFLNIGRFDRSEDAILPLEFVASFPVSVKTPGQAIYAEALMRPEIAAIVCTGPAGSGKTYLATIYGYDACKNGEFIGVTVVPCESHSKLGALPGDLNEKMDPDLQPLKNALRNYLLASDKKLSKELEVLRKFGTGVKAKKEASSDDDGPDKRSIRVKLQDRVELIWGNWFSSVPIENARGRDFSYEFAIYDEFQDQNVSQADTLIKRIGREGKIVLTGDIYQIHAPYLDETNNGLSYASHLLYDHPMVAQVCLTDEEVVRHPLVKEVAKRQKELNKPSTH